VLVMIMPGEKDGDDGRNENDGGGVSSRRLNNESITSCSIMAALDGEDAVAISPNATSSTTWQRSGSIGVGSIIMRLLSDGTEEANDCCCCAAGRAGAAEGR